MEKMIKAVPVEEEGRVNNLEEKSMAEQKKPAGQQNKRPRLSQNAESSGKKSSALAVTSPVATKAPTPAVTSPVAAKTPAQAAASPVATKTPAPARPCPAAMKTPVLSAPSPVAMVRPIAMVKPTAMVTHEQGAGGVPEERDQQAAGADANAEERVNVDLEKKWLHCSLCPVPLKPPIFKCEGGHAVCCTCAGGTGAGDDATNKHCGACNRAVSYTRDSHTEGLVGACKVPCPYKKFGCTSKSMAYHKTAEHKTACACAPCYCRECPFEGSPARLLRHLTEESGRHSWPAETIKYDTPRPFVVPGSSEHRLLLVAEEDNSVFLLAVGAAGRGVRPVTVVCVRGNTADDARPRYRGVLWVFGPPAAAAGNVDRGCLKLEEKVASCAVPGEMEMEHGLLHAYVNPAMLHGESKEIHLCISIIKFL